MLPARTTPSYPTIAAALAFVFALSGCATTQPGPTPPETKPPATTAPVEAPPAPAPAADQPETAPPERATPPPRVIDPAAAPVVAQLARQLRIAPEEITVVQVARAEWPNGCLGLAAEGEICSQAIVPGYAVSLIANDQRYEYRTDESGRRIRLAFAPLIETGEALVTWKDSASFSVLVIGTERVAFGLRGGPRLVAPLPRHERAQELLQFVSRYAPFYARTAAGEITFRGIGNVTATPLEQRQIAEWARLVAIESDRDATSRDDERAFVWRREGGVAGFCDEVVISRAGRATARPCRFPEAKPTAELDLAPAELEQFYRWLDGFAPFAWDDETGNAAGADAMTLHLELAGQGTKPLTELERERMLEFSNALVRRLLTDGTNPAP